MQRLTEYLNTKFLYVLNNIIGDDSMIEKLLYINKCIVASFTNISEFIINALLT